MLASLGLYFAVGLGLGSSTSLIPGVANLAVIEASVRGLRRRAMGLCAGAATADAIHATAAVLGIAGVTARYESAQGFLFIASGIVIAVFGALIIAGGAASAEATPVSDRGGFGFGLLLTLSNPAALLAWIAVAAAIAPGTVRDCLALSIGVGVGAFAALSALATLGLRGRDLRPRRQRFISRGIGIALVALAIVSAVRGAVRLAG